MENLYDIITENYKKITYDISNSAIKAGKNPKDITFLAATKTVEEKYINHAIALGLNCIGENKVQELCTKFDNLNLNNCDLQFIGNLQSNKIKNLVGKVSQIQSIDSITQVKELSKLMIKNNSEMKILIEVNIGDENSKAGVKKENLLEFIDQVREFEGVKINGLMTIPPINNKKDEICEHFLQMNKYFVDIRAKKLDNVSMNILSMGMSYDFKEAIMCGSNMVRVGSALFGSRIYI